MTKKDYIKAAKIVNDIRIHSQSLSRVSCGRQIQDAENAAIEVENAFILLFQGDNPRFNKQRFLAACNGESIK
jgi:hypothetical protein